LQEQQQLVAQHQAQAAQQQAHVRHSDGKVSINKPPMLKEKMKNEDVDNWISQIRNWIRMQEEFSFHRPLTEHEKV